MIREKARFLVCGEALFDLFFEADEEMGMRFSARVGGSPFNVALGLARLGREVGFFSGISNDFLGARLVRSLETEGVSTEYLIRKDAATTLSLVGLGADGSPSYAFYGHDSADRSVEIADLPEIGENIGALHFGSYSLVAAPSADAFAALAQKEAGKRLISVDPNVRLNVEPDIGIWRSRMDFLLPFADLVKISEEDIEALFPGVQADNFARQWMDRGAGLVVVTKGVGGAVGFGRHGPVEVPSIPVDVVDAVGAGDSFQAALLCGLDEMGALSSQGLRSLNRETLGTLLNFAAEAASLTCSRRGADLPTQSELREVAEQ
ncbi:MAG: carbohydrate kinase [Rhodospirillales bacterium]|nr:carbohydrate kinase [Rhodospirillales bacterium]